MDIQKLTTKFEVRKLNESDIEAVYKVMQDNPLYFKYCPPMATHKSILDDMKALRQGRLMMINITWDFLRKIVW